MRTPLLAVGLVLMLVCTPLSAAIPEAGEYADTVAEDTHLVAQSEIWWVGEDDEPHGGLLYYPTPAGANSTDPAPIDNASGPFPLVIWFGDEDEDTDNYDWICESLASAGYLVFALPPDWNGQETPTQILDVLHLYFRLWENDLNGSGAFDPDGMRDAFDLEHWGVAGHGLGAKKAAMTQLALSQILSQNAVQPPRAMVALGLEQVNTFVPSNWIGDAPGPGMGLYLTGTADDLTPGGTNVERWFQETAAPWHYMEVVGANHVQYQDEIGIWEAWNDGDAAMEQDEQQGHAMEHIRPYLDLMLKGDHQAWLGATSRETDWTDPTDADAYLSEDLAGSTFFPMNMAPGAVPLESADGANRSVEATVRLTHRDGSMPTEVSVTCSILEGGDWWSPADYGAFGISSPGTFIAQSPDGPWSDAHCEVPTDGVPPGNRTLRVEVAWKEMPSVIDLDFFRENLDPIVSDPMPTLWVPQHGNGSLTYTSLATDPDGTAMRFEMVPLSNTSEVDCWLDADAVHCSHTGAPEWSGSETVQLTVYDLYDANWSAAFNLTVNVLPVDDPVVQISPIPRLEMQEDDGTSTISIRPHFSDPEGADPLIIDVAPAEGLTFAWFGGALSVTPDRNWHGAVEAQIWVGDGGSDPVLATMDITVAEVADPPVLNSTAIQLLEDTPIEIPLADLAWDDDGDAVTLTVSGGDGNLTMMMLNSVLRITPPSNWHGNSTGWVLTAESGGQEVSLQVGFEVLPVDDAALFTWGQVEEHDGGTIRVVFAVNDPDGALPWDVRYKWDEAEAWAGHGAACQTFSAADWECEIQMSTIHLLPGTHRLTLSVADGEGWSQPKEYAVVIPALEGEEDPTPTPKLPMPNAGGDEPFSIWVVLGITGAVIATILGIGMLVMMSREDAAMTLEGDREEEELDAMVDALDL